MCGIVVEKKNMVSYVRLTLKPQKKIYSVSGKNIRVVGRVSVK